MLDDIRSMRRFVTRFAGLGAAAVIGLIFLFGSGFTVDAGEEAVVLRLGAIQGTYGPGFHFKIPLIDSVRKMDVRVQKHVTRSEASSRDLQVVHTEIALNYQPDRRVV